MYPLQSSEGSRPPKQTLHAPPLHDHAPPGDQTDEPHDRECQNGEEEELRVVQERERIIPQEGDVGVVDQGRQVQRVPQEGGEKIARAPHEER